MRLSVEKITDISTAYTVSLTADELNCQLGLDEASGRFVGEARVDYRLARVERRLLIEGSVHAELSLQCGRCLKTFVDAFQEPFSLALNLVDDEADTADELELDEERINSITMVAGEVDLLPVLYEQFTMLLPGHALCREDCAGICPYCGIDLNTASCDCEPPPFNNRFGKLKDLKL